MLILIASMLLAYATVLLLKERDPQLWDNVKKNLVRWQRDRAIRAYKVKKRR